MRIDGSLIEITDGLEAEIGDSYYYTSRHVIKRFGHANNGKDGKSILVKKVDFFGFSSKCSILFENEKFAGVSYTINPAVQEKADSDTAMDVSAVLETVTNEIEKIPGCTRTGANSFSCGSFHILCSTKESDTQRVIVSVSGA